MSELLFKEECYEIIGHCFEVHNNLGKGFAEIVYKDALEIELDRAGINYSREKQYNVNYKGIILSHCFKLDFLIFENIVVEIKGVSNIREEFIAQAINYLKISQNRLALIVNFGEEKLTYKRIIV
ncbi:MAG: GxxExxY protein [Chitinophagaceae bacterium]|nr:GxxExxY protein [Chitinophagaceae bacterium]